MITPPDVDNVYIFGLFFLGLAVGMIIYSSLPVAWSEWRFVPVWMSQLVLYGVEIGKFLKSRKEKR